MTTIDRSPGRFLNRRKDWRYGHVLYQVFLDRFAPSSRIAEKGEHYTAPRSLRSWDEVPQAGHYLPEQMNSSAELQFWGGDIDSLRQRLDYLQSLGIDVVYLNPIFHAYSNHKYDAMDYFTVDPQFGTRGDLEALVQDLHGRGMRLLLDGVFNHVGRRMPQFQAALKDGNGADWFYIGEQYKHGYRGWRNVGNLPELNLENPIVRRRLWWAPDSVVQTYIREVGIDGWRLDVAPDVGFQYLAEITEAAHRARPDTVVIGECWNYPEEWLGVLDGIMNMHARTILLEVGTGRMGVRVAAKALERMVDDGGIDGLLKSHIVLDNHDLPRLSWSLPDFAMRKLVRQLQFLLPGCPVVYYGSELGMEGGHDPTNRAPMRWDLQTPDNPESLVVRELIKLRQANPALRIGDFRLLEGEKLLGFLRLTNDPRETILVLANFSDQEVSEVLPVRDSRLMDAAPMECLLSGEHVVLHCGLIEHLVPAKTARVFRTVDQGQDPGYSMFKRAM